MAIEDQIYNALDALLPTNRIKLVIEGSSGTEPTSAYALIARIDKRRIGQAFKTHSTRAPNGGEVITQTFEYDMSITFHMRPDDVETSDLVDLFNLGLSSSHYVFTFAEQGLSLVRHDHLRSLILPVDGTRNYKRLIQDITVRTNVTNDFSANNIKEIYTNGDLKLKDFESHIIFEED